MSPSFQTGRRSAILARRIRRRRLRFRLALVLAIIILVPGFFLFYAYYLEWPDGVSGQPEETGEKKFDPQLVYTKARSLLENGRSNEHRGRRSQVKSQYREALELMEMISKEAPEYRPEQLRRDIEFLRGRLRKVR